jgi:hypothetical protein
MKKLLTSAAIALSLMATATSAYTQDMRQDAEVHALAQDAGYYLTAPENERNAAQFAVALRSCELKLTPSMQANADKLVQQQDQRLLLAATNIFADKKGKQRLCSEAKAKINLGALDGN